MDSTSIVTNEYGLDQHHSNIFTVPLTARNTWQSTAIIFSTHITLSQFEHTFPKNVVDQKQPKCKKTHIRIILFNHTIPAKEKSHHLLLLKLNNIVQSHYTNKGKEPPPSINKMIPLKQSILRCKESTPKMRDSFHLA